MSPITLFETLQKNHSGEYPDSKLRTFQRRVRKWKALYGPDREVMFLQHQISGHMGLSDFTKLKNDVITIAGEIFNHLLYHFRLAFSGWCSVKVVHGGESNAAFAEGLQDALQGLLLRGSNEFETVEDYEEFLSEIVTTINRNKKDNSQWDKIVADTMMIVAAIDRLVHHARIIEIQAESFRRKQALEKKS